MGLRFVQMPWGRANTAHAGVGASSSELLEGSVGDSLQAFVDAESAGTEDHREDGPIELDALLGERWQTV